MIRVVLRNKSSSSTSEAFSADKMSFMIILLSLKVRGILIFYSYLSFIILPPKQQSMEMQQLTYVHVSDVSFQSWIVPCFLDDPRDSKSILTFAHAYCTMKFCCLILIFVGKLKRMNFILFLENSSNLLGVLNCKTFCLKVKPTLFLLSSQSFSNYTKL